MTIIKITKGSYIKMTKEMVDDTDKLTMIFEGPQISLETSVVKIGAHLKQNSHSISR